MCIYAPVESGLSVLSESALVIAHIGADLQNMTPGEGPAFSAKDPLTYLMARERPGTAITVEQGQVISKIGCHIPDIYRKIII